MLEQAVSAVAGGVWAPILSAFTGLVGGVVRGVIDLKARRLEVDHEHRMMRLDHEAEKAARSHELAMHEANMRRAEAESEQRTDELKAESEMRQKTMDLEALIASHQTPSSPRMEEIKSWVRIMLTLGSGAFIVILTALVGFKIGGLDALDEAFLQQLFMILIVTSVSLGSLSYGWWFSTRPTIRKWMEEFGR